jgi:ABC-2 type transport system ATP-binding protein
MEQGPIIDVTGLTKQYAGVLAVDRLDFQVGGGTVLGLVGPNGAGKTTSMRCMTGIIPATAGRIRIAGHDLETHAREAKRHLAFVPDTPHLFDYLTVEEHLRFSGRIYGIADVEARADGLLAEFGLLDRRQYLPGALSRGMKQKAAICMAFLHDPRAIFLDEPLTGLDPIGIRTMKDSIVRRATDQGAAVVVSSHQLELIEEICDVIFVIKDGRKIIAGSIEQIRSELSGMPGEPTLEDIFFRLTDAEKRAGTGD